MLANYARKWPIMLAKMADYARQMADYAQIMLRFRCFRALRARVYCGRCGRKCWACLICAVCREGPPRYKLVTLDPMTRQCTNLDVAEKALKHHK